MVDTFCMLRAGPSKEVKKGLAGSIASPSGPVKRVGGVGVVEGGADGVAEPVGDVVVSEGGQAGHGDPTQEPVRYLLR